MVPYVISHIGIPEEDIVLLDKISRAMRALPPVNLGTGADDEEILLSCHMLARAIGKVFRLEYRDGYFHSNYEHAWVLTKHYNIIDVYPIAILTGRNGGPFLMSGDSASPARGLYKENKRVRKYVIQRVGHDAFRRHVKKIVELLRISSAI